MASIHSLVLPSIMLVCGSASAADITLTKGIIVIQGIIEPQDYSRFMAVLTINTPSKSLVSLHSNGGKIDEAIKIGREIRSRGWATTVATTCQSACALIWLSGVERYLPPRVSIGFHQPFLSENDHTISVEGAARIGAYLNSLGYGDTTIKFVMSEPPDRMRWILTESDAKFAGVTVNPKFPGAILPTYTSSINKTFTVPSKAWPDCSREYSNESYRIRQCDINNSNDSTSGGR